MRLGSIQFINSLPVDLGILSKAIALDAQVSQAAPTDLNRRLFKGELDLSPVSALWYAEHQEDLLLLPDLSISSESGVQSVLLFSKKRMSDLGGARIAVTDQGRTTPALLEILCRFRYNIRANFVKTEEKFEKIPSGFDAMLLIGDEALLAKEKLKNQKLEIIDLAEEWKTWTKKPFVFALWAVRKDYFENKPVEVLKAHKALLASRSWGSNHAEEILVEAQKRSGLSRDILSAYFACLSFHFDKTLQEAVGLYFDYAAKCGFMSQARPLEFISEKIATVTP